MKEYIINDFINLKLENGFTKIYIDGKCIYWCRYLIYIAVDKLKNIFKEELNKFSWEYIEQNFDIVGFLDDRQLGTNFEIDPELEFWAHCSNLQGWCENLYDLELVNYLFLNKRGWGYGDGVNFILKHLAKAGDDSAIKKLREYKVNQFTLYLRKHRIFPSLWSLSVQLLSGHMHLDNCLYILFIDEANFVDLLEKDLGAILKLMNNLEKILNVDIWEDLWIFYELMLGILDREDVLISIDNIQLLSQEESYRFKCLLEHLINDLFDSDEDIIQKSIPILIRALEKIDIEQLDFDDLFNYLTEPVSDNMEENFSFFVEVIDRISYETLSDFIYSVDRIIIKNNITCLFKKINTFPFKKKIWAFKIITNYLLPLQDKNEKLSLMIEGFLLKIITDLNPKLDLEPNIITFLKKLNKELDYAGDGIAFHSTSNVTAYTKELEHQINCELFFQLMRLLSRKNLVGRHESVLKDHFYSLLDKVGVPPYYDSDHQIYHATEEWHSTNSGEAEMPSGYWQNYGIIAYSFLIKIAKNFGWLDELILDVFSIVDRIDDDFKDSVIAFNKRNHLYDH